MAARSGFSVETKSCKETALLITQLRFTKNINPSNMSSVSDIIHFHFSPVKAEPKAEQTGNEPASPSPKLHDYSTKLKAHV